MIPLSAPISRLVFPAGSVSSFSTFRYFVCLSTERLNSLTAHSAPASVIEGTRSSRCSRNRRREPQMPHGQEEGCQGTHEPAEAHTVDQPGESPVRAEEGGRD